MNDMDLNQRVTRLEQMVSRIHKFIFLGGLPDCESAMTDLSGEDDNSVLASQKKDLLDHFVTWESKRIQLFQLIMHGYRGNNLYEKFGMSAHSVKTRVHGLRNSLKVKSRSEMVIKYSEAYRAINEKVFKQVTGFDKNWHKE